jgi:hypothetical protein
MSLREVPGGATINVSFVPNDHGDGKPFDADTTRNVLAHAFYPGEGRLAGDMHFDFREVWSAATPLPGNAVDVFSVAVHEFGHAIGLTHSSERAAVMFPSLTPGLRLPGLHADDINRIQDLYGVPTIVPGVVGEQTPQAVRMLRERRLGAAYPKGWKPNATVIRQSPGRNARAAEGSKVDLILRGGEIL